MRKYNFVRGSKPFVRDRNTTKSKLLLNMRATVQLQGSCYILVYESTKNIFMVIFNVIRILVAVEANSAIW